MMEAVHVSETCLNLCEFAGLNMPEISAVFRNLQFEWKAVVSFFGLRLRMFSEECEKWQN